MTSVDSQLDGLLIVDKPGLAAETPALSSGAPVGQKIVDESTLDRRLFTSHDVVQRVRRLAHQRRIGHTGTLDPMASGVLVLCLGWATRLVEYYQGHDKRYRATIQLGAETDTADLMGTVVEHAPVPELDRREIEATLRRFVGTIEQRPPVYSALKQDGESLHRKARRGEQVDVPPRTVTFYALDLLAFSPPGRLDLMVHCSAGAYVRSLAVDLGRALGTLGHLAALRREAAGPFTLQDARPLPEIEAEASAGNLGALLVPPGEGLPLPAAVVDEATALRLSQGQRVALDGAPATNAVHPDRLLARSSSGRLLGVLRPADDTETAPRAWRADKWFGG